MLPPPQDSVGARILKKMGWRLGQGIGPRISWRQRQLQDLQASLGPNATLDDIPEDEEAKKHTFARRDTPVLRVERKDNSHGLGYVPEMGLLERLGAKGNAVVSGPKLACTCIGLASIQSFDVVIFQLDLDLAP
jgi:G patch domain-containing protein 1